MAVGGSSMAVNEPVPLPQLKSLDRGPASAAYDFRLDAGLVIRRAIEIAHPVDDLRRARDRTHGRDEIAAIGGHSPCLRLDCRFPRYFRGLRDSALGRFERKSRQTTSARGRPQSDPRLIESPCRLHGAFSCTTLRQPPFPWRRPCGSFTPFRSSCAVTTTSSGWISAPWQRARAPSGFARQGISASAI